jgi:hypothetical protein
MLRRTGVLSDVEAARSVSATTWRPGPAVREDDDSPRESIEEYIARGKAMKAAIRAKASGRPN